MEQSAPMAPSAPPGVFAATNNPYIHPGDTKEVQLQKLRDMINKYEITICQEEELTTLMDYNIVFLVDDSGSMTMSALPKKQRKLDGRSLTRWEELRDTVTTLSEIACHLDPTGVDIHFLNRSPSLGIRSAEQLSQVFDVMPKGQTPLATRIAELPSQVPDEKPVLLLIATDGEPDEGPSAVQRAIGHILSGKHTKRPWKIQILACTPDEDEIAWLNNFDKKFRDVDVMDDFNSERDEVLRAGRQATFNKADYVCKALLGPIIARFDAADENPHEHYVPPVGDPRKFQKLKQASGKGDCQCCVC
eukprot:TRINITY_DN4635_c1_g3_i1.p1 TRINITY_DN4635_c1_g3~~TRINITY_DN4635_c1_g3_i1.p1  ORF type:complete len:318 (+),score=64.72 TRINITY_DN4635_c1_g3_i1:45-956(+)